MDQDFYAAFRERAYIRRQATFDALDRHASGQGKPLVVLGESGAGKSALMANWGLEYRIYFFKPEHGSYGWAGADYTLAGKSFLRAIDYKMGKIVWDHPIGDGGGSAGVLTTATGLTISGDNSSNLVVGGGSSLYAYALP